MILFMYSYVQYNFQNSFIIIIFFKFQMQHHQQEDAQSVRSFYFPDM